MKRLIHCLAAMMLASIAFPGAASAATARVTVDLNMRAGPGTDYPVVTTINDGARVDIHGCVSGYSWCDVSWSGSRGWVDASYLTYPYRSRYVQIIEYGSEIDLPIIAFSIDTYWNDYYRGRPWYGHRSYWRAHSHGRHHRNTQGHARRHRSHQSAVHQGRHRINRHGIRHHRSHMIRRGHGRHHSGHVHRSRHFTGHHRTHHLNRGGGHRHHGGGKVRRHR